MTVHPKLTRTADGWWLATTPPEYHLSLGALGATSEEAESALDAAIERAELALAATA